MVAVEAVGVEGARVQHERSSSSSASAQSAAVLVEAAAAASFTYGNGTKSPSPSCSTLYLKKAVSLVSFFIASSRASCASSLSSSPSGSSGRKACHCSSSRWTCSVSTAGYRPESGNLNRRQQASETPRYLESTNSRVSSYIETFFALALSPGVIMCAATVARSDPL